MSASAHLHCPEFVWDDALHLHLGAARAPIGHGIVRGPSATASNVVLIARTDRSGDRPERVVGVVGGVIVFVVLVIEVGGVVVVGCVGAAVVVGFVLVVRVVSVGVAVVGFVVVGTVVVVAGLRRPTVAAAAAAASGQTQVSLALGHLAPLPPLPAVPLTRIE